MLADEPTYIFQDDNTEVHQAQFVKEWFSEHKESFSCMNWSPQSPDLTPIESLCWSQLYRAVRQILMEINAVMLSQCHNACTIQSNLKVVQQNISLTKKNHRLLKVDWHVPKSFSRV